MHRKFTIVSLPDLQNFKLGALFLHQIISKYSGR